jgi:hypothetical protein
MHMIDDQIGHIYQVNVDQISEMKLKDDTNMDMDMVMVIIMHATYKR